MSPPLAPASDYNLLFGMLALQMDFIQRDQLIMAMQMWVLDKSKSLGAVLVDQHVLTAERYALLGALVREHVKQHHNDPQQSLAAIPEVGAVRNELEKLGDAGVQASLLHVAAARNKDDDPDATSAHSVGARTSSGLRFQILRPHAHGGLGSVFVAHDEELQREVALKEIQTRHADNPDNRSRFLAEAQITGKLEHPGIVPVYGLGHYADGRPYYAMRFIKGSSLKEAIDGFHNAESSGCAPGERNLELRKLLGRFIDVCEAIQYAHDRGVLHRDLKPGNIMLGKYGETLVVDWGLAKPLGARDESAGSATTVANEPAIHVSSASAKTLQGSALGTPHYMSPEQAAGRVDSLGPLSDVYSLGATLYCLLTGRAPVQATDVATILRKVQMGDFPRPRQVNPEINPALAAICVKAMALKPADRYSSPRHLADDLERWLADKPVGAWPEPWTVRTRRWIGQHQTLVTGVAAAVLVSLVGGSYFTWRLSEQNEQLQVERDQKEEARLAAVESAAAEKTAREAEAEQRRQAQAAADLLESAFRRMNPHETGQDLKLQLASRFGALMTELEKAHTEPLMRARLRSSLGLAQLGLGEPLKAVTLHELALEDRRKHLGARHRDTLTSLNHLAVAQWYSGQTDKATALFEEALEGRRTAFGADDLDTLESMNDLAVALNSAGHGEKALPLVSQALKRRQAKLGAEHPLTLESQNNLAVVYQSLGQPAKAVPLFEDTLAKQKRELGPDHPYTLITMNNLGVAHQAAGEPAKAIPWYQLALEKQQVTLGPDHPETLLTTVNLAQAYHDSRQPKKALPLFEIALKQQKARLPDNHPQLLSCMSSLAAAYQSAGQTAKAISLFVPVLDHRKTGFGPDHRSTLEGMCFLAMLYQDDRQPKKALDLYKETLEKQTSLFGADDPDTLLTMNNLAVAYQANGQMKDAMPLYERTLEARRKKLGNDHRDTLVSMNNLAVAYHEIGKTEKSVPLLEEAFHIRKTKLGLGHPDTLESLSRLSLAYQSGGQPVKALQLSEEALEAAKVKFGADHPDVLRRMNDLAAGYWLQAGQLEKAITLFQQTLKARQTKLGVNHAHTLVTQSNLALALQAHGRPEQAEPLWRELLAHRRKNDGPESAAALDAMASLGLNLLRQKKCDEAEPLLRQCLEARVKKQPNHWSTADVRSMLGAALAGQSKFAEGESLLLQGYEGLKANERKLTLQNRERLTEAVQRLVDLYDNMGRKEQAHEWRQKLPRTISP